jgi:signal transduction histidine kinase/ActR/RegA family two-component response regulator
MGLVTKLVMPFLAMTLAFMAVGYYISRDLTRASLRSLGANQAIQTSQAMATIEEALLLRLNSFEAFSQSPFILSAMRESNQSMTAIPDREARLTQLNAIWSAGGPSESIEAILTNPVSKQLQDYQRRINITGSGRIAELFVTNTYGAVIATTNRTSDYLQADEAWYQQTIQKATPWIGGLAKDESSQTVSLKMVLPVFTEDQQLLGVVNVILDLTTIEQTIGSLQRMALHESTRTYLVDANGRTILQFPADAPPTTFTEELQAMATQSQTAPPDASIDHGYHVYRSAMQPDVLAAYSGFPGSFLQTQLGWQLIIENRTRQLLGPIFTSMEQLSLAALLIVIFVATACGLFIHHTVVRPVRRLSSAATALGEGKLEVDLPTTTDRDEVGTLSTAFAHMSRSLAAAIQREKDARFRAEKANQLKDQFLATLSHELRTPLNVIAGWVDLGRRGKLTDDPKVVQTFKKLADNVDLELKLFDDLFEMSGLLRGKVNLSQTEIDLNELVQEALKTVRFSAEQKQLTLDVHLDHYDPRVRGDKVRLEQVIWNLLSNAVKFTPKGGRITITMERSAGNGTITVADTGIGIDPDFLPHIFDAFRQQDSSLSREYGGLGIGLSIAKTMVELHGGSLQASSAGPGEGASFTVSLPLLPIRTQAEALKQHQTLPNDPQIWQEAAPLKAMKILIVDDMQDILSLLEVMLKRFGADVLAATSVIEALDRFDREHPTLVISDISMPGQDGYQLIKAIRSHTDPAEAKVPAIALSAQAGTDVAEQALQAGYQMYLTKPVALGTLISSVRQLAATPAQ